MGQLRSRTQSYRPAFASAWPPILLFSCQSFWCCVRGGGAFSLESGVRCALRRLLAALPFYFRGVLCARGAKTNRENSQISTHTHQSPRCLPPPPPQVTYSIYPSQSPFLTRRFLSSPSRCFSPSSQRSKWATQRLVLCASYDAFALPRRAIVSHCFTPTLVLSPSEHLLPLTLPLPSLSPWLRGSRRTKSTVVCLHPAACCVRSKDRRDGHKEARGPWI